jgi:hypothetical protein
MTTGSIWWVIKDKIDGKFSVLQGILRKYQAYHFKYIPE